MLKRGLIVLSIAAAHFFISNLVYGISYRRTTRAIISNGAPTLFDSILGYTFEALMFPYGALRLIFPFLSATGVYLSTSLFWAIALYSMIALVSHSRRTRKRQSSQSI